MQRVTRLDTDMFAWPENTRHYRAQDGKHFAVQATLVGDNVVPVGVQPMIDEVVALVGGGRKIAQVVVPPTVIIECDETGWAPSLTPVAAFPPGTSHEDALTQMGYEVS